MYNHYYIHTISLKILHTPNVELKEYSIYMRYNKIIVYYNILAF